MKNMILALALLIASPVVFAADAPKMNADQAKMMEKMKAYSTPGEQHKMLSQYAGEWTYTMKSWMEPGAKTEESTGKTTAQMILGGRWLQQNIEGTAMGQPWEGLSYTGYNNLTKQYETIFLDSMGTGSMHGTGSYDKKTKTLADSGDFSCPLSDDKKREYRGEWKFVDKNNMTYTMYMPDLKTNKEFKMMEINYKRSQQASN
jgi:hypothetical protein